MSEKIGRREFEERLELKVSGKERKLIMLAYKIAKLAHRGQTRDDGETRYFNHPKAVALILIEEFGVFDWELICAALLHDVQEDVPFFLDWDDYELIWGKNVLDLVFIATKEMHLEDKQERDKRYKARLRKADRRPKILKLADRLHNLRDLGSCSQEKQRKIIEETVRDYLPMARRTHQYSYRKMLEICELLAPDLLLSDSDQRKMIKRPRSSKQKSRS